jgi:replicative DNA helicase
MKQIPISDEGEKGLLGGMLLDPDKIGRVSYVKEEWFYYSKHKLLYKSLIEMYVNNMTMDTLLIKQYLIEKDILKQVGGEEYMNELMDSTLVASHSVEYAKKVEKAYRLREDISILERGLNSLYEWELCSDEIISNLTLEKQKDKEKQLHEMGDDFIQDCIEGKVGSFDWWCPEWTMQLGKMKNELMIFHAPRSTGKTALMLQWIINSHEYGKRTPLASIEMLKAELLPRMIANVGKINTYVMRTRGHTTNNEVEKSKEAVQGIKALELCVRDKAMSIDDIRGWAISESRKGVDAIFIDNLLSINDGGKHYQSKTIMYDYFIRKLRDLRDDLNIPIIILAHPNTEGQVAWSRDVENFADVILYLEEVVDVIEVSGKRIIKDYEIKGDHVVAKFQKNRQGLSPIASLSFNKETQTFNHVRWE